MNKDLKMGFRAGPEENLTKAKSRRDFIASVSFCLNMAEDALRERVSRAAGANTIRRGWLFARTLTPLNQARDAGSRRGTTEPP